MATNNNHFISRFLTQPWEFGQRQLRYFDFETNTFDYASSDVLFAEENIFSQTVEDFLNFYVETPFSKFRNSVIGNPHWSNIRRYEVVRSIFLMICLQGVRVSARINEDARNQLEELATKDDNIINVIVETMRADSEIMTLNPLEREFFCVSDIGIFCLWLRDESSASGLSLGWFIPAHPQVAVGIVSKTIDKAYFEYLRSHEGLISAASMSFSDGMKRIIIPEEIFQVYGSEDLGERFKSRRGILQTNNRLHAEAVQKAQEMYAIAGLTLRRVPHNIFGKFEIV